MDDLAEFLLELILEGAAGAAGSRRVPMPVRVLAACAVGLLWFGTGGLALWCGLATHSAGLAVLGAALLACALALAVHKVRGFAKRR